MIVSVALCLGGLMLVVSAGLASVFVKAYDSAPPLLLLILRHLFDFLFALTEACCRLAVVVVVFLYNVVTQCFGSVFLTVVPALYHIVSTLFSFTLWVCIHLIRGLLGLEAKALNTLSWLIAICGLFLYLETRYQDVTMLLLMNRRPNFARFFIRNWQNGNEGDIDNDEIIAAGAAAAVNEDLVEFVPEQMQENQLLEIENRENENEENALEEADRNRVNIDNVQNDQRELDRDRAEQVQPVRRLDDDDSSDYELDPTLCSVCLHRARGAALFPCGHTQLCRICARIIIAAQRPCPMCQTPIQEFRNVYV